MTCTWLAECCRAYYEAEAHIERLYEELSAEQLGWKPAEDRWSILQCIDHLSLSREGYLPRLRKAVDRGTERGITGGEAPYGHGTAVGRFLLRTFQKPWRFKTVKPFEARDEPNPEAVIQAFRKHNAALIALTEEADGLDLGRLRVGVPATGLVRLSLAQGFYLGVVHDARHLAQAEAVREEPGFPAT